MRTIPTSAPPRADSAAYPLNSAPAATPRTHPDPHAHAATTTWRAAAIMDDPTTAGVLHSAWSGDPAVVVPSPPGAGKTRLVALLAATLAERADLRVGIAAQTRNQALEIASRVGLLSDGVRLMWPIKADQPVLAGSVLAVGGKSVRFSTSRGGILIGTTARWLFGDPAILGCDLMIVDEAWQATFADLGALGAFAGQVVCVGDPGQIEPVVTGQTRRWSDSPTGPHLPAPAALLAAHGDAVSVVTLRHTWRLGPATTALIQPAFYPSLPFTSRRPPEALTAGTALPELQHHAVSTNAGPNDPALTHACADHARHLLTHSLTTVDGARPVQPGDLAVVCSHVSQAAAVRAMLADVPDVLVGTANQLQGMERPAVVALHPLAGYREFSEFAADRGRACVMLSRHRAHLTVIGDTRTPDLLRAADPSPVVSVHRQLLEALTT